MYIKDIRRKAEEEQFDIQPFIQKVYNSIKLYPNGTSLYIPEFIIPKLESHCDRNDIPIYVVTPNCVSVAKSYSQLLAYEKMR